MKFAASMRSLRHTLDITQEELARAVGLSSTAVNKIETGQRRHLRLSTALRIADYFTDACGVTLDDMTTELPAIAPVPR